MSLGLTWVRARDGYFYAEPILAGKGWFITFDEDEPPEVVIALSSSLAPEDVLRAANVGFRNLRPRYVDGHVSRSFGRNFDHFEPANSWYFDITKPLDPKHITRNDGRQRHEPFGTLYDFPRVPA